MLLLLVKQLHFIVQHHCLYVTFHLFLLLIVLLLLLFLLLFLGDVVIRVVSILHFLSRAPVETAQEEVGPEVQFPLVVFLYYLGNGFTLALFLLADVVVDLDDDGHEHVVQYVLEQDARWVEEQRCSQWIVGFHFPIVKLVFSEEYKDNLHDGVPHGGELADPHAKEQVGLEGEAEQQDHGQDEESEGRVLRLLQCVEQHSKCWEV